MFTALSGTPGVGKTDASEALRERGYNVLNLNELVEESGLMEEYDEESESQIVDIKRVNNYFTSHIKKRNLIIEGHLSHLLSVDRAIILRCNPLVLRRRLEDKGWPETKVMENVRAEVLDVVKVEAHEAIEKVFEVDTTHKSPKRVADSIETILKGKHKPKKKRIDWMEKYEYLLFGD